MKLTGWHAGCIDPVRVGAYQIRSRAGEIRYAYWRGHNWSISSKSIDGLLRNKCWPAHCQYVIWRGIKK